MEGLPQEFQIKYQKLASEYSKLRSQAQVLKKGFLDEQARANNLTDLLKEYEQRIRKSDLEMESISFRNQQLTKRIGVLQDELESQSKSRFSKNKQPDKTLSCDRVVLDEELKNKIMDNARLQTLLSDKDVEVMSLKDRITYLESQLSVQKNQETEMEYKYKNELTKLKNKNSELNAKLLSTPTPEPSIQNGDIRSEVGSLLGSEDAASSTGDSQLSEQLAQSKQHVIKLKQELEYFKAQNVVQNLKKTYELTENTKLLDEPYRVTDLLGSLTSSLQMSNEIEMRESKITEYFFERINELVADKETSESVADSFSVECHSLQARLEDVIREKVEMESKFKATEDSLRSLQEELSTTSHNYETQLSTMSDHLANMNDKLTSQCDEIHQLKYQLGIKDKKQKPK